VSANGKHRTKKYLISSKHDDIECYINLISLKNLYSIPIH
jgi:hypothetical protein